MGDDFFKGLEVGGMTFRGVDSHGGATFEHECGCVVRVGPDAKVSVIAEEVKAHKCHDPVTRFLPCDMCGKPATRKDSGAGGWYLNYCEGCAK